MPRWKKPRKRLTHFTHAGLNWRKRRTDFSCSVTVRESSRKAKSNDRVSANFRVVFDCFQQGKFEVIRIRLHLAGSDLLRRCTLVAEFANAQSTFGTHRRSKYPARHGARFIEFAVPCF